MLTLPPDKLKVSEELNVRVPVSPSEAKNSIRPSVVEPEPRRSLFSETSTERAAAKAEPPMAKSSVVLER